MQQHRGLSLFRNSTNIDALLTGYGQTFIDLVMGDNELKRVTRLTAILLALQTRRLITATALSEKFSVSVRTIYRDIRTLEQAAVPILTEEGKGYSLMEGYRMPPVMFSDAEAHALITAEQLVLKGKDSSLIQAYTSAIDKIRAVLQYAIKDKVELLADRIAISPAITQQPVTNQLMLIQEALTAHQMLHIAYQSADNIDSTAREVEPFAFYYSQEENWLLIAYCRLRKDYRMFRLDKISNLKVLDKKFEPHKLTLTEYLAEKKKNFNTPDKPLS